MKLIVALFVLLFASVGAGPAPCIYQNLWTQCLTPSFRVGNNAATNGAITNPSQIYIEANAYLDNSGANLASATATGYTELFIARTATAGGTAIELDTNYQDAQTQGSSLVITSNKQAILVTGDGTVTLTQGQKGVTNGSNACTGCIGEELIQTRLRASGTALTSATTINLLGTALTLTAGDWEMYGACGFSAASSSTSMTVVQCGVSQTSATLPADSAYTVANAAGEVKNILIIPPVLNADQSWPFTTHRVSLSGSTTFYLVENATFTVATANGYGTLAARRMR